MQVVRLDGDLLHASEPYQNLVSSDHVDALLNDQCDAVADDMKSEFPNQEIEVEEVHQHSGSIEEAPQLASGLNPDEEEVIDMILKEETVQVSKPMDAEHEDIHGGSKDAEHEDIHGGSKDAIELQEDCLDFNDAK